jgi:hypothetical protein
MSVLGSNLLPWGYYHGFLIIPFGERCPFVGFLAHRSGTKPYVPNFAMTEF